MSIKNVMLRDDIDVHKYHMPFLWLFSKFSAVTKEWPTTLEYKTRLYRFVSQEVMPNEAAGNYSGYAKYELQETAIAPLTHGEFGAFMEVVGTAMRLGNSSLHDALAEDAFDIASALQGKGIDAARSFHVVKQCVPILKTMPTQTVPSKEDEDGEQIN